MEYFIHQVKNQGIGNDSSHRFAICTEFDEQMLGCLDWLWNVWKDSFWIYRNDFSYFSFHPANKRLFLFLTVIELFTLFTFLEEDFFAQVVDSQKGDAVFIKAQRDKIFFWIASLQIDIPRRQDNTSYSLAAICNDHLTSYFFWCHTKLLILSANSPSSSLPTCTKE